MSRDNCVSDLPVDVAIPSAGGLIYWNSDSHVTPIASATCYATMSVSELRFGGYRYVRRWELRKLSLIAANVVSTGLGLQRLTER